jgi:hypothetical protein
LSVPGASPLRAPAGAEKLDVLIDGVSVEGGFAQLAGETTRLEQSILDRRVTVAELYAFANALEVAYEKAGFVLVRTALPPQQLYDHGRLRVLVIDGYVSSIDVKGLPARVRDVIAARVAPLINQRHLTLPEIERSLLIAGDVPGVSLRSTLTPGALDGATVLVIEGTQKLVTGTVGIDDRLPGSEGTWQYMGSLAVNSPFGFGEQFYTSFGLGADIYRATSGQNPLRLYGGGVVVPLGTQGLTINPEYSRTATSALPIPGAARVLMAVMPFIGASRAEAEDKRALHDELINPVVGLSTLAAHANSDFSALPLDADGGELQSTGSQGNLAALKSIAGGQNMTIAEAGRIYGRGVMCPRLTGTAADIADELIAIADTGAADGFVVSPAFLPETFEDFVDSLVPLLQAAGRVRQDYTCTTLRGHLGLA